jgi:hypothetical protein
MNRTALLRQDGMCRSLFRLRRRRPRQSRQVIARRKCEKADAREPPHGRQTFGKPQEQTPQGALIAARKLDA